MIFDSNVVIELIETGFDSPFADRIGQIQKDHSLYSNIIIFAEVSSGFPAVSYVSGLFDQFNFTIMPLELPECYRAGRAFAEYRQRGGTRSAILPDFLIGAQAEIRRWPLVTRDRKGFASYFPDLEIIDPLEAQ